MVVGITRVVLAIPGTGSLKEKRSVVKKLLDRVRARFHVSAAEVDLQDVHTQAVLGVVTVGSETRRVAPILERVVDFIDAAGLAQIVAVEHETVSYAEGFGAEAFETYADKFGSDESWPPPGTAPASGSEEAKETTGRRVRLKPGSLGFGSTGDDPDGSEGSE